MISQDNKSIMKEELLLELADGMELYTEYYHSGKMHTVLFIHGGPGESCVSFSYFAALGSEHFNIVMCDQRGVMRSQEETNNERISVNRLIDDFEEVREILKIKKWFILGHSFGGYIAMRYVMRSPQSILGVIYENPCFHIGHSLRAVLKKHIDYYNGTGEFEKKLKAEELLQVDNIVEQFDGIRSFPELDRKHVFISEAVTKKCMEFFDPDLITEEALQKCDRHYNAIKEDQTLRQEYLPDLIDVEIPSLLIQGEKDPLLPQEDLKEWLRNPACTAVIVANAGHYVHSDAPEKMIVFLRQFIGD